MYNERTKEDNLPKSLEDTFCRMPTDPDKESSINLDTNIVINTQKKTIFSLGLSLREVLTAVESQAERFCFLFRRNKSKECYVNYLRGLLFEKEELAVLRPIFIKIIDNYRTAKNEVKALRAKMKLALGGVTLESYKRLASGESFIKMKEFHDEVLQPIKDPFFLNSESQEYLLKSLLCFLYLALEKKLTIDIQTEDLVIRLLLKTRRFLVLHQMVQNSILEDRLMLALLLCELGTKVKRPVNEGKRWLTTDPVLSECIQDMDGYFYAPAFQVGIDMLHRLRINEKEEPTKLQMENFIFEYHVRNNRILECVEILETKKIKLSIQNLENLLVASNTPESNYSFKKLIVYFSMKQTRERILGSNEKFDEIVTKIIKQNEFMKALTQD